MQPPPGATGSLIGPADAFDVPVFVRRSAPLSPSVRPRPNAVASASRPWPTPSDVPPSGAYRVATTWRDVIDAAMSVGRDVTTWLTATPVLAWAEIVARRAPLSAYLGRTSRPAWGSTGFVVEPNVVYTDGTEATAKTAFGYRMGMTMAEWACRGLLGLGPTTHAESLTPVDAGPAWSTASGLPDLVGYHPATGDLTWLVEAKGSRRLGQPMLANGVEQLCRQGLMVGPHMRVLCGTSLEDRLFMIIDVEEVSGTPRDDWSTDDGLLPLARSRMLLYLALRAMPTESLTVLPVGSGVAEQRGRRGGLGTVALLEDDPATEEARREARSRPGRRGVRQSDMLTAQVPGTDLVIGMSRRLYGACASLARVEAELVSEVNVRQPPPRPDAGENEIEDVSQRRLHHLHVFERERRSSAAAETQQGYYRGAESEWDDLVGSEPRFSAEPVSGYLEAATEDIYLAVDDRSITGVQR
nr:hypothetical protein GCM10017745_36600 [Saccharothrix mutabilis subsp. capreolus]